MNHDDKNTKKRHLFSLKKCENTAFLPIYIKELELMNECPV